MYFTVIQVLKGVTDRPEVSLVKLREIKCKLDKKTSVQDRFKNTVSVKDVVRIVDGPCRVRSISLACFTFIRLNIVCVISNREKEQDFDHFGYYLIILLVMVGKTRSSRTHIQGSFVCIRSPSP